MRCPTCGGLYDLRWSHIDSNGEVDAIATDDGAHGTRGMVWVLCPDPFHAPAPALDPAASYGRGPMYCDKHNLDKLQGAPASKPEQGPCDISQYQKWPKPDAAADDRCKCDGPSWAHKGNICQACGLPVCPPRPQPAAAAERVPNAEERWPEAARHYRSIYQDQSLPLDDDKDWCWFVEGWAQALAAQPAGDDELRRFVEFVDAMLGEGGKRGRPMDLIDKATWAQYRNLRGAALAARKEPRDETK